MIKFYIASGITLLILAVLKLFPNILPEPIAPFAYQIFPIIAGSTLSGLLVYATMSQNIEKLKKQTNSISTELKTARDELELSKSQVNTLKNKLSDFNHIAINAATEATRRTESTATFELKQRNEEVRSLQEANKDLNNRVEEGRDYYRQHKSEIANLSNGIQLYRKKIAIIKSVTSNIVLNNGDTVWDFANKKIKELLPRSTNEATSKTSSSFKPRHKKAHDRLLKRC